MKNSELERIINEKLDSNSFKDNSINGLQIEGRRNIKKIVTGVTACQELLDSAYKRKADAIIVHHGLLWKNDSINIRGIKRSRIKSLLINNVNLYAWHLPLDAHNEIGNNSQLAVLLNIKITKKINPFLLKGELISPLTPKELQDRIENMLGYKTICYKNSDKKIKTLAWCTGSGQNFFETAVNSKVDAFITGETSERSVYISRESGVHFYAAGHYATEIYGVKTLGEWILQNIGLDVKFIETPNAA